MATVYVETPRNYSAMEPYVLTDKKVVAEQISSAERLYFYDTCAFRKHAHLPHPEWLFSFIKRNKGTVVLTRCILMELASKSGILDGSYVDYFKKLYADGITVLLLDEEDLFTVLSECFSSNELINRFLSFAVKTVKNPVSTIESTLKAAKPLLKEVIVDVPADGGVFRRFFSAVRGNKESGDNLGEELLAICVHLLSNLPDRTEYKYFILTEDKGAVGVINKAVSNVHEHSGVWRFSALTTPKLAQCFYEENIICEQAQVEELLLVDNASGTLNVFATERYDLERKEKHFSCTDLAKKIVTKDAIHLYF